MITTSPLSQRFNEKQSESKGEEENNQAFTPALPNTFHHENETEPGQDESQLTSNFTNSLRPPTTGLYDGGLMSQDPSRVVSSDKGEMLEQTMNIADGKVYGEAFEYDDSLPANITHVVLQNGGYGNIVYSLMYLLQKRIVKYFNGEHFDDVSFS